MILPVIRKFINKYITENNGPRSIIVDKDKNHLKDLIKQEMKWYGNECDLNHIDVSNIIDMEALFYRSKFNGNISKWNVSKVESMYSMFGESMFNGEISDWDVSNVKDMDFLFTDSKFNRDLSKWKPYSLEIDEFCGNTVFSTKEVVEPYWSKYIDKEARKRAIDSYHLEKELRNDLDSNDKTVKRMKL
jgi:hypothetical protein